MRIPTLEELAETIKDPERKDAYIANLATMPTEERLAAEQAVAALYMRGHALASKMPLTRFGDLADYRPSGRAAQRRLRQMQNGQLKPNLTVSDILQNMPEEHGAF